MPINKQTVASGKQKYQLIGKTVVQHVIFATTSLVIFSKCSVYIANDKIADDYFTKSDS